MSKIDQAYRLDESESYVQQNNLPHTEHKSITSLSIYKERKSAPSISIK